MLLRAIRACEVSIRYVQENPSTCQENKHLDMVEQAISVLEDDPHLNAGLFLPVKLAL